jgi:hypothetical protein
MQGKNTIYVRRSFKQNFILIMYETKVMTKLMFNKLKVMGGLSLIYTPLGT